MFSASDQRWTHYILSRKSKIRTIQSPGQIKIKIEILRPSSSLDAKSINILVKTIKDRVIEKTNYLTITLKSR